MLIPRFSLRTVLILMTVLAVLAAILGAIVQQGQQHWLAGLGVVLLIGVGAGMLMFLFYLLAFALAAPFGVADELLRAAPEPTSPFATNQPPPQILPPQEPE